MASNPLECPACHGATSRWATKAASELRACPACRTVSAVIPEESESEGDPYDGIYSRNDLDIPDVVRASLDALMASVEAYRHTNNLCDIGFGAGLLLTTAQERGWRCYGTETSTVAIEMAQPRAWRVFHANQAASLAPGTFDVVTAIELLEHLPAPNEALALAARLLRPGGLFYLTTPNARSLNSRLLGARWSAFAPPEHRTIWSPDGLRRALSAHGLKPEHMASSGLNPYDLLQRLRPRHRARAQGSTGRVEQAYRLNASLSSSPLRRAVKRSINSILNVAGLGDTLKVWATLS